jgi:carboxymethylenebutenolidase
MRRLIAISVVALGLLPALAAAADRPERVTFPSKDGKTTLVGYVFKPASPRGGRVPAVVMMHGRAGAYSSLANGRYDADMLTKRHKEWGERWAAQGHVALMVDGFGPRGYPKGFPAGSYGSRPTELDEVTVRPLDAYGALAYLRTRPDIAGDRIGLMGWSNGGSATLASMATDAPGTSKPSPQTGFRAALAFYPGCGLRDHFKAGYTPYAPVHVFQGTADEEVSASLCKEFVDRNRQKGADIDITLYPNATHDFDDPGQKRQSVEANATANRDAATRAVQFFSRHLQPASGAGGCSGLSGDLLDICNKHNADRAEHGVPPLTWSPDLAKNAQNWVKDCRTSKEKNDNVLFCHQSKTHGCGADPSYKYGENLSWGYPTRSGLEAVDGWYCAGDPPSYDYDSPKLIGGTVHGCSDNSSKVNGVFTQVVWKATKFFGCAKNTCTLGGQSGTLWACEYDPPGNDPNALKENVPKPINPSTHGASKPPVRKSTVIISDVDLYDQPGGSGKKTGILRKGQTLALVGCRADNWCQVAGGWVWGSFIVRNHSR